MYRLVTKNTYEEQLFQSASRKYGLDEAILGDNMGDQRDPEQGKDIENLLLKGAYHCLQVRPGSKPPLHGLSNHCELDDCETSFRISCRRCFSR